MDIPLIYRLCELPRELPRDFSPEDRSFLDTNLMNKRFFLLNYVMRAIAGKN